MNSKHQIIADIALMAGYLIATEQINIINSRELIRNIIKWSGEFETTYGKDPNNYLEEIDQFSEIKLNERYGGVKNES